MPHGIILAKWDDQIGLGALLEAQFPPEGLFSISTEDLMTIYTFHSMGGLKSGFLMISRKDLNVASYFFDLRDELNACYYLSLILTEKENALEYQNFLTENALLLIPLIKNNDYQKIETRLAILYTKILLYHIKKLVSLEKLNHKIISEKDQEILKLKDELDTYKYQIEQLKMLKNLSNSQNTLIDENIQLIKELKKKDLRIRELENYVKNLKMSEEKLNRELSNLRTKIIDLKVA
ncbi:MAG: hypothetical protein ACTSYZ_10395 [Candidatus Helarchaeota archaeon]